MRAMNGRVWTTAIVAATAYAATLLFVELVLLITPYEIHPSWVADRGINLAVYLVWIVAIVVLIVRQPDNDLWKIVVAWAAAGAVLVIGYIPTDPTWPLETVRYLLGDLWAAVFVHIIVAYPSGRLQDRTDRRLVVTAYVAAVGFKVAFLAIAPADCRPVCGLPALLVPSQIAADVMQILAIGFVVGLFSLAIREIVRHYRRAGPAGRRVIGPMVVASSIWCAMVFAGYAADMFLDEAAQEATHSANLLAVVQGLLIPGAILVGALLSQLARGNVADLAMEIGRGVPVGELQPVLARAMRDPSLELAFPSPSGDGFVDPAGRPFTLPVGPDRAVTPIERDGATLAVLVHDPTDLREDPELVEAVGSVARMALENERLSAQVRAQLEEVRESRARLVEAGDAERRRIERDLHDGAQQRLTTLAIRLQTARSTMPEAAALLDDATAELQAAVGEVRDLARGVHPTLLHDLGLAAAVDALAERATIPVEVDIPEIRLPGGVEATAYFVVAEALTNVARYADAKHARVHATVDADTLVATVEDDGRGGADPARGTGLRGLADRVAAARGRFDVTSPVGGGTTVRVELPLA
jgi:signal transduction histidine kinase